MKHIVIGGIFVLLLVAGMVGYKLMDDAALTASSDSGNIRATVNIGVDNWAGYSVICSTEMRRLALEREVLVKCHDDGANYPERMAKLKNGDLEMAVATVDGYIATAEAEDYPASILFVIDESQGGDAIIANINVAKNTNDLKGKQGLRIAYTPDSPSATLAMQWANDFNVPINDPTFFTIIHSNGSSDALKKLQNGEVDVAVLWEPDVSKALANSNVIKLLGTENTKNLIVDVLLANERYIKSDPEIVKIVTESYFLALHYYNSNPAEFEKAIMRYTNVRADQVASLKDGIDWISLPRNAAEWLGINHGNIKARRQILSTIDTAVRLLVNSGVFADNPLPNGNPLRIINSTPFTEVFTAAMNGQLPVAFQAVTQVKDTSVTRRFKKLSPGRWTKLKEVGSLRIQAITFKTGTSALSPERQDSFVKLVEMLATYPHYRIKIVGHSGRRGNKQANMDLSKQRSLTAARWLMNEFGIDKHRIYAYGVGNQNPPVRQPGEKKRAWSARWPRVELILVGD